ncbi:MAG TPA: S8 family serine peptidase, partial [Nakamurella sp.]
VLARCATAGLLLIGLMVAPSGASPAGASSHPVPAAVQPPVPAAVPTSRAAGIAIPNDVAALVAQSPADIIVGVDPAPGVTAAQRSAVAQPDAADRQAGADRAEAVYAGQKDSALASAGPGVRTVRALDALPVEVVRVDTPEALAALAAAPGVTSLSVPAAHRAAVDADLDLIHQPQAQQAGYTGAGVVVAVLDTGVDYAGVGGAFGNCSQGPGTGTCRIDHLVDVTHTGILDFDGHGTNVSGVVAKTAPGAHLDVYGVFGTDGFAYDTDILAALNAVARTGPARNVRAVNLSLGDGSVHTTECTASAYSSAFSSLRAVGILPVVAAGNSAYAGATFQAGVASPACAIGAIRVGAVYPADFASTWFWSGCTDVSPRADQIACFSQGGSLVSLLAPGVNITAAGITESGTSQAAPHVAGAIADLVTANPSATASQLAQALTSTGPSVTDSRDNRVVRRLDITAAANAVQCLSPVAAVRALSSCPAIVPGMFTPLTPSRLLDTRSDAGGPVPAMGTITVQITGAAGIPSTGVSAVAINVTAVSPTGAGYITAWRSDQSQSDTSNLNFSAGQTIPNLVIAPVSAGGKINLFNGSPGTVHLVADVAGYFRSGTAAAPGAFKSLSPTRILDTRTANGAVLGPVPAFGAITIQITGRGDVPAGASAVALNVIAVDPTGSGHITAWPGDQNRPDTSNLNFSAGQNIPNLVIAPIGVGGKINLYNGSGGTVQLVGDVAGYFVGGVPSRLGAFSSLTPNRVLDTRVQSGAAGPVPALGTITVQLTGRGGVPVTGVTAVAMNVTAVGPAADGFVTAWPSGLAQPNASNLNFSAGQTIPNTVIVPIGVGGKINLYNGSGGTIELLADVSGYFLAG